jgi:polyhydroxyalkanoate synthesis repressor PhaR
MTSNAQSNDTVTQPIPSSAPSANSKNMADETIQIKRYPNRRFYARNTSKYVSMPEIEEMIRAGHTVEVRDSQTGDDITHLVLTQIIMDRQPEKIALFPIEMLHSIVRSNDMMTEFLRDYFRHSLTYLEYLKQHGTSVKGLANPVHWVKAWLDGFRRANENALGLPEGESQSPEESELAERIAELEARIRQLETAHE